MIFLTRAVGTRHGSVRHRAHGSGCRIRVQASRATLRISIRPVRFRLDRMMRRSLWEPVIDVDRDAPLPPFLQIARSLAADIQRGRLRPGDRLPGSRRLAASLQVHRNTVLAALAELTAEGWIETAPGARDLRHARHRQSPRLAVLTLARPRHARAGPRAVRASRAAGRVPAAESSARHVELEQRRAGRPARPRAVDRPRLSPRARAPRRLVAPGQRAEEILPLEPAPHQLDG
jgi:hypothetical protein